MRTLTCIAALSAALLMTPFRLRSLLRCQGLPDGHQGAMRRRDEVRRRRAQGLHEEAFLRPVRGLSGRDHPNGVDRQGLQSRREKALRRRQAGRDGGLHEIACSRPQR